jgi:hypothetical protein
LTNVKLERRAAQNLHEQVCAQMKFATVQKRVGEQPPQLAFLVGVKDQCVVDKILFKLIEVSAYGQEVNEYADLYEREYLYTDRWREHTEYFFWS